MYLLVRIGAFPFFGLFLLSTLSLEGNAEKTSDTSSRLGPKNDQPKTR